MLERLTALVRDFEFQAFSLGSRIALAYLALTVLLAFGVWLARGRPGTFVSWLLPRAIYSHRSNLLDLKLFLAYRVFTVFGLFSALLFTPLVAYAVLEWLSSFTPGAAPKPVTWARSALVTLIVAMAADFCKYWAHRLHHESAILWPFHAVHHSADVLTPMTLNRVHPVETLMRNGFISVLVGVVQALAVFTFVGEISLLTIGGANALYVVFNAAGANLRHSHIWLSYGRVMEHVFISPAQHQVHHSIDVSHHNKNYGSMFAIWDWMFGTLYVPPNGREELSFGLGDAQGRPQAQAYPTLSAALFKPFRQSGRAIARRLRAVFARRVGTPR